MSKANKPILCVDFDGVLHSYSSGWQGARNIPDPPVPGAIEWLEKMLGGIEVLYHARDELSPFDVQIFSSRSRYWFGRRAMKRWLVKHGLHPAYISERWIKFPLMKPPAFITLDDRAVTFTGTFPTEEEIKAFKPWNKKKV